MKVVINVDYGGFGLSAEGEDAYLARKGKQAFRYSVSVSTNFERAVRSETMERPLITMTYTEDLGDEPTQEERSAAEKRGSYFYDNHLDRDDPDLVAVVEELGNAASGRFASLRVVEIPDDVEWQIEEYDGSEWVAEKHRTWR